MATISERPVKILLRRPKAIPFPISSNAPILPLESLSAPGNTPTHSARPHRRVPTAVRIGKILKSDAPEELKQKRLFAEILFGARDGDLRYMLSNQTRSPTVATSATSMSSYTIGGSILRPRRARGPAPLPSRPPIRACLQMQNLLQLLDEDDRRYVHPPLFTLNDFLCTLSDVTSIPLPAIHNAVFSRRNYKKIVDEVQAALFPPSGTADGLPRRINLSLDPFDETSNSEPSTFISSAPSSSPRHQLPIGVAAPRLPARQIVTEVAALMKEQVQRELGIRVECVVKYLPKYVWRPEMASESDDDLPLVEIIITEQGSGEKVVNYPLNTKDLKYGFECN